MDLQDKQDCESSIGRIRVLLGCGVFSLSRVDDPLLISAFIDLVIRLRDLLSKTEQYARRVSFTDGVVLNSYVRDVTDAVAAVRDACCHIKTHKRELANDRSRVADTVMFGVNSMRLGGIVLASEYQDDVAFFYGPNRLYLRRHVIRAFNEACTLLAPHLA
jgi:hypothetical protein